MPAECQVGGSLGSWPRKTLEKKFQSHASESALDMAVRDKGWKWVLFIPESEIFAKFVFQEFRQHFVMIFLCNILKEIL